MFKGIFCDKQADPSFGTYCATWLLDLSHVRPWDVLAVTKSNQSKTKTSVANGKSNGHALNGSPVRKNGKPTNGKTVPFAEDANGKKTPVRKPKKNGKVYDADTKGEAIDDPVRMYLMQMGEIPLLTREEEVDSAKEIERTRENFRNSMLATDFILQASVVALEKVRDGELRLDRTIEVSVTNTAEKKRIMSRIVPNVDTLRKMLVLNHEDFRKAINKTVSMKERQHAWRRLTRRRKRAVRLVEEMNLSLIHI